MDYLYWMCLNYSEKCVWKLIIRPCKISFRSCISVASILKKTQSIGMQNLIISRWKIMTKTKNLYILILVMWIVCMDGQCPRNVRRSDLSGLKTLQNLRTLSLRTMMKKAKKIRFLKLMLNTKRSCKKLPFLSKRKKETWKGWKTCY